MKTLWKRTAWLGICLVVTGCQTPVAMGRRNFSASEQSGAFAAQDSSDSGDSGSGDSSNDSNSDSGNSSDGSGNSSDDSGNSSKDSGHSSDDSHSDLNQSSKDSSDDSTNNSSDNSTDSTNDSSGSKSSHKNPVASATVIGLTAAALGAVFWQAAERAMREPPKAAPPPQQVAPAAQTYLRSRAHQLREDLALGAGPTVEELASMARIRRENVPAFGRLLHAHRQELLALADVRTLTPERALTWLKRVGEIARTDSRLEEDRDAFLASYGGEETSP